MKIKITTFWLLLIAPIFIIPSLQSCDENAISKEKSQLLEADYPSVVTKVEIVEKCECDIHGGKYRLSMQRGDGSTFYTTSNIQYSLHDTITLGIDTTSVLTKTLNMETSIKGTASEVKDTTQITDTLNTFQ